MTFYPNEEQIARHGGYGRACRAQCSEQKDGANARAEESMGEEYKRLRKLTQEQRAEIRSCLDTWFLWCCILGGIACTGGGGYGVHTMGYGCKGTVAQSASSCAVTIGPCCCLTGATVCHLRNEKKEERVITTQPRSCDR